LDNLHVHQVLTLFLNPVHGGDGLTDFLEEGDRVLRRLPVLDSLLKQDSQEGQLISKGLVVLVFKEPGVGPSHFLWHFVPWVWHVYSPSKSKYDIGSSPVRVQSIYKYT